MITSEKNVGMNANNKRVNEALTGEFVAICEGDDYWTDPDKLQKQVDFLKLYPECSMVFHSAEIMNVVSEKKDGEIRPYNQTQILDDKNLFFGGGDTVATASIVYRHKFMYDEPEFYRISPVGDHAIALLLSAKGKIGYINENMSIRTLWVANSWNTIYNQKKDNELVIKHVKAMNKVLSLYNEYTGLKYNAEISKKIIMGEIAIAKLLKIDPFKKIHVKDLYKKQSLIDKIKLKVSYYFPKVYDYYTFLTKS